ncbi:hypothetical protein DPMN_139646 [Dreissena polymorpha]|uniref:Uncharacterized protein n=1 Tax=Dreissena polymorpha TaxID=45954 RepID=A0A9D4G646_DREPO|nr:hypothetical protein DPMN_139646 [Dreissena polymorpha]
MLKQNFGWARCMWAGRPIINRFVVRDFHDQFEINWFRNEEAVVHVDLSINLKEDGNHAAFICINGTGVGNVDMDDVQDLFEVNWLINEEVMLKQKCWWAWLATISSYTISTRTLNVAQTIHGSSANSGGGSGQGKRT